jgi:hypothetical protein
MPYDKQWVRGKLEEIEHKRAILKQLEECLTKWEEDIDWGGLSPAKQAALMAMAEQSTDTLEHMIKQLSTQIKSGLRELADETGIRPNGAGG